MTFRQFGIVGIALLHRGGVRVCFRVLFTDAEPHLILITGVRPI